MLRTFLWNLICLQIHQTLSLLMEQITAVFICPTKKLQLPSDATFIRQGLVNKYVNIRCLRTPGYPGNRHQEYWNLPQNPVKSVGTPTSSRKLIFHPTRREKKPQYCHGKIWLTSTEKSLSKEKKSLRARVIGNRCKLVQSSPSDTSGSLHENAAKHQQLDSNHWKSSSCCFRSHW